MFHNSGKKIMGFVKFVFYINAIFAALVVLGFTIFLGSEQGAGAALLALLIGIILAGLYMCIIYLSMLCIYAFGELVQSNTEQTELLRRIFSNEKVVPAPGPIPTNKVTCPKCKADQEKDAAFCRFCGTPINNSAPIPPKPTPESKPTPNPDPVPVPKPAPITKEGKVLCPHCGARHVAGTTNCKYCGTAMK